MNAIVEVDGITRSFGETHALRGIDLAVPEGGVVALLGPNGAGKTTLVRILSTLIEPDAGTARVAGFDVVEQPIAVRRCIGLAGQYAAVDETLTGRENLEMVGRLSRLSKALAAERAAEVLERVSLTDAADRQLKTYSGGMRRRIDLGAGLVARPRVLLLDEPTTGLDPANRLDLWAYLRDLVNEGSTILLTTQYLEEADQLARRIGIIDHGRIVAEGTPEELKSQIGGSTLEVTPALATDEQLLERTLSRFGELVPTSGEDGAVAVRLRDRGAAVADVVRALDQAGVGLSNLALRSPTLDDVFLAKTGRPLDSGEGEEPEPQAEAEAAPTPPEEELRMAAAGRSRIEKLPTAMLKDWMAERHLQEAREVAKQGTPALAIRKGPLAGQTIKVEGDLVIGREGDLVIADPEISRRHCVVRVVDGTLVLDDLQSLNGTWVNGKRIEFPTLLAPGDMVQLGTSAIEVIRPPTPALVSAPGA
jgi:daunorubicin resistance ABC transporter ATP-binding subunit